VTGGSRYRLLVREGSKFSREGYDSLDAAFSELKKLGKQLERTTDAKPVNTILGRRFDPVQQVAARLELHGPKGMRGGVDIRGDGSSEAYTGWIRRKLVSQRAGESAYDALRRELHSR
jgi:hypothetical protein